MKLEITIAGVKQTIDVVDTAVQSSVTLPITVTPILPPKPEYLNLLDFGALPNGTTDCLSAINAALAAAKSQKKKLYIPPGRYLHSNVFTIDSVEVFGEGDLSEFVAGNALRACIFLKGSGSVLRSVKHTISTVGIQRQSAAEQASICAWMATGFNIENVTIAGGASIGVLVYGSTSGLVRQCRVTNTLADSYHVTYASSNIGVLSNFARNCGDDGVAVVSYGGNPTWCSNVSVIGNDVGHNTWGRGITVCGGTGITIEGNTVSRSNAAGLLIAAEGSPWNTYSVNTVVCRRNTLSDCVQNATIGHPAVLVTGRAGFPVANVTFESTVVSNPRNDGFRFDQFLSNILVKASVVTGVRTGYRAFNVNSASVNNVVIQ
jgi:hypothetical protein